MAFPILTRRNAAGDPVCTAQTQPPGKHTDPLVEPSCDTLLSRDSLQAPAALLLHTKVYIHRTARRLHTELQDLIDRALLFHCSVTLAELETSVANADPARSGGTAVRNHYAGLFASGAGQPAADALCPDLGRPRVDRWHLGAHAKLPATSAQGVPQDILFC